MDPLVFLSHLTTLLILVLFTGSATVNCTTFTFANKCGDPVWPGILSNAGSVPLGSTGFELPSGASRSFPAPAGWSGRFWARTGCAFDPSTGRGACSTGDCGSGSVECGGAGAAPPATLAEFTLASPAAPGQDFYDVSLVDGYNLPMAVVPSGGGGGGGSSSCKVTGCAVDLSQRCPAELKAGGGTACRSACEAFGKPEDCCSGAYASPATCRPSVYSQMFKAACPRSYSYAFDDATSTFTCTNADYTITFCPDSTPSQKASTITATDPTSPSTSTSKTTGEEGEGEEGEGEGVMLADNSWLANLATGASGPTRERPLFLQRTPLLVVAILLIFFSLV